MDIKAEQEKKVDDYKPDPMDLAVDLNETKPIKLPKIFEDIFRQHLGVK
jgi:hypothetical protein